MVGYVAADIPPSQSVASDSEYQHAPHSTIGGADKLAPRQHVPFRHSDIFWPNIGINGARRGANGSPSSCHTKHSE